MLKHALGLFLRGFLKKFDKLHYPTILNRFWSFFPYFPTFLVDKVVV